MLPESCRSRMVRILAAIWRLVPPCSTAAHLLHALTTSSPPPATPSFTLSSYYLTNISKFMRFYLISLACTSKPTPPFPLSRSFSSLLGTPSCALRAGNGNPPGFFPSVFSCPPLSFFSLFFIHFLLLPISIVYIHTHIFLPKETWILSRMHVRNLNERSINFIVHIVDRLCNAINFEME